MKIKSQRSNSASDGGKMFLQRKRRSNQHHEGGGKNGNIYQYKYEREPRTLDEEMHPLLE